MLLVIDIVRGFLDQIQESQPLCQVAADFRVIDCSGPPATGRENM